MRLEFATVFALALSYSNATFAEPQGPWRVMSGDGRLISSDCLGSNATPECLAETALACEGLSPAWSSAAPIEEHALCQTPGLSMVAGTWPIDVDHRLVTIYYMFDPWTLRSEDLGSPSSEWQAGDTALDIHLFACAPRPSCLGGLPEGLEPDAILKSCPPIRCGYSPAVDPITKQRLPDITYILRKTERGWAVVDMYSSVMDLFSGAGWTPDHWYLK